MVRRRLSDAERASAAGTPDAGHTLTDVVGTLVRRDVSTLVVEPRRGPHVEIAVSDVVAAKEIPPSPGRRGRPHRAVTVSDLEELMVDGWRPLEVERRGRWLLRAGEGYTRRANSCLVLGPTERETVTALDDIITWYRERGLPPLLQVPLAPGFGPQDDDFVREVTALAWQVTSPTLVMTAASAEVSDRGTEPSARSLDVEVDADITPEWWQLADERARSHDAVARRILTGSPNQAFVTVREEGVTVAHGRMALAQGWGGLFEVAVTPERRRRGLARALVGRCADEAARRGARSLYLQVGAENTPAVALYKSLGFTVHHTYVYLRAPEPASPRTA